MTVALVVTGATLSLAMSTRGLYEADQSRTHLNQSLRASKEFLLADIAGFYGAFGLDRSPSAHDRLDHLSFEAEFLEILIARELQNFAGFLRFEMAHEEETLLSEAVLGSNGG